MRRSSALWMFTGLLLTATAVGQGVLTYPDIAYYRFNEGAGNQIINWAVPGSGLYAPTFFNNATPTWNSATPQFGASAIDFAGTTWLRTGWPTNLSQSFTIEAWIRTNTVVPQTCTSGCTLFRLWGDYSLSLLRCYVGFYNPGANFLGGGFPAMQTSTAYVTDGNWHHVALVHDRTAQTLTSYVDGNLDQTVPYTFTPPAPGATSNFILGATATATSITGTPFNGQVDEFRIWGEARSQLQIQSGLAGELPDPAIRALFNVDRRTGPAHLLVKFRDFSVSPVGPITSWFWDFGDGTQSTQQNPCHVYTTPGTYTVALTVNDGVSNDTLTSTNYITVGAQALTVASCGQGDLYLATPTPPPGWTEGFTLLSLQTSAPTGLGWFFGLYPDAYTFGGITYPAVPGSPLHFTNIGNPLLFPDAPLPFPPGTFTNLSGLVMDCVVLYLDGTGQLSGWTSVSRARF